MYVSYIENVKCTIESTPGAFACFFTEVCIVSSSVIEFLVRNHCLVCGSSGAYVATIFAFRHCASNFMALEDSVIGQELRKL